MSRKNILAYFTILIIFLACTVEVLMLTKLEVPIYRFYKNGFGWFWSPIVLLASGLVAGIGFLSFFYRREINYNLSDSQAGNTFTIDKRKYGLALFLLVVGVWKCAQPLKELIRNNPQNFYDPKGSDVIPQIGIMVDRFLSGTFPYRMITEWTLDHALFPTYLPMTWMPFIIPDVIGFDYRWMAFGVLMLGFFFFFKKMVDWNISWIGLFLMSFLSFYYLYLFQDGDKEGVFRFSVESMIAGYYLILALAIFSNSNWLRGGALALCLLSRYSVVLWVPLFFFVLFFKEKKSNLFKITGVMFLGFLLFYAFPFLSQDPYIFIKGYDYHTDGAIQAWKVMGWQNPDELPANIFSGLGFGGHLYHYMEGSLVEKVHAYQRLHLGICSLSILIFGGLFWKIKDRIDYRIFLLGALKVYLVLFYNFIQIPFNYLYLTMVFVSLPMLGLLLANRERAASN